MSITFDKAIEIFEIPDISKVSVASLSSLKKKVQARWHPDRISHLNDPVETEKYTQNFQSIDAAYEIILEFLNGNLTAGERVKYSEEKVYKEPHEVILENLDSMKERLYFIWPLVKEQKYEHVEEVVELSDGFSLKELLKADFKEDIFSLSIISFIYGIFMFFIFAVIAAFLGPLFQSIVSIVWIAFALSCLLGFLPLSRFWMPEQLRNIVFKFIDFGLSAHYTLSNGYHWVEQLISGLIQLFSTLVKYIILFPLYEAAKILVKERRVGIVRKKVSYFGGVAEWYIEDLLKKDRQDFTEQELYDFSSLYNKLSGFYP